ncbi:unnamed protein product [Parascedosporium putredinis]|uniref:Glutamine-dependent NAD(+) synthetase n=1 Tax=Parascedosporium putredinis TaxID=1442378 RepID=A0A9P1H1T6_9PEZI|nr:unnamed protein product [Parascedosporium putredinis]CAI7993056.1 unnamed protein product [Parascedosporium putredinis]
MALVTVAAATLPSVPLDFLGNRDRILESIRLAKKHGATLRTGPELEIPGYSCLDHHLEGDTFLHSWEVLAEIISDEACKDMLIDLGMGVRHRNVRYNARVLCTYRKIFCIRPKMALANDGLYREARHFTAWTKQRQIETYYLEGVVQKVTGQRSVPIGDMILSTPDTAVACESCEEMFVPLNPSIFTGLNGAEIILNSSASHAELRKLRTRLELIANSTRKLGGIYVYANATGVDGEARMMHDGSSMVIQNGEVLAQGSQFSLAPVEITVATVDIEKCDIVLSHPSEEIWLRDSPEISQPRELRIMDPMEEIHLSTTVYLWHSTVALFVYGMARIVLDSIAAGETTTLADLRRVTGDKSFSPKTPEEIVNRLLHTCYMGTVNSSGETEGRAKKLAEKLGAFHSNITIDETVAANEIMIQKALNFKPKRAAAWAGTPLLVLGSGNVDENLRGYFTKYDASSADIAPLGSISKNDAKAFQRWARHHWDLPILTEFIEATPTAELLPLSAGVQDDESESEMGMSYDELSVFGILRKVDKLGPWSAYLRLLSDWRDRPGYGPRQIAEKVFRFYRYYAINRHKATINTPSIHLCPYNPDDNRHDLRPFLYVVDWPWQFRKIRAHVEKLEQGLATRK